MADMSIFSILNTGVLGTYTAKLAMSVTAHNISNTNTQGYSRQRPQIVSTAPLVSTSLTQPNVPLALGTGSMVKRIERVRDQFLDTQFRVITENHSYWDNMSSNLHYMEQLLNEPAENGFREYFDKMWFSFQEVMSNPTNEASIQSVKSEVNNFISTFKDLYGRFEELRSNLNNDIRDTVNQINTITSQIGNLNSQIRMSYIANSEPNDLLDERDNLLDELNKYANTTIKKGEMGHLEIYIGQQIVVHGDQATPIKSAVRPETLNTYDLFVRSTKIDVQMGKLGSMLQLRDVTIPAYLDKYDEMSLMMADKLNLIHQAGYDKSGKISGVNLFKEMEQLRSSLPNLFRMSGTNAILNGPIHMATSEISTNPSGTSLGISGNISFVDLNNYLFDKAISTDTFQTNKKFEEVIESLNTLGLYSTFAKNITIDDVNSVIHLDDFDTYDGGASIFYRTTEELTSADDGIIKIPDLIDIDGDGQYLDQDIEIFDEGLNQYKDFSYEISTGVLTIQGLPDTFNGNLIVNRWKNEEILVEDGEIGFSGITNKFAANMMPINTYNDLVNTLEIVDTTYTGPAELYYVTEENVTADFSSGEGEIVINGKLIDINNDGYIDLDDLRIQADGSVDIDNFSVVYDKMNDQTTIKSNDLVGRTTVLFRRWTSDTGTINLGQMATSPTAESLSFSGTISENDFKVFQLPQTEDMQVYIKTIRSDVRRSTDLNNNPTGMYSMMFGKIDDGINQYGEVDSEKVNALGDLNDMLVLDNNGLLERLGYNTKVQSFLKISDFTYNLESREKDGLYGTWWLDGFVNETNMGLTGTQIEILDDSGSLETDFNDPVHVFYVAEELGKAVHLENGGFKLENLYDINDDKQITSEDISIQIDTDADGVPDTILADGEFTYDSESEQIKLTDPAYENYNGTIVMDFRRWHKSYEDFTSGTFDSLNLPKTAVSLAFSGTVGIGDFRLYKEPIVNIPQEIPDPDDLKSISFTVPVELSDGSTTNRTYNVEFYNKQELVTKINNNLDLRQYIKAFEHDGDYYISSKGSLEDISNVVVNDEYNLLSTVDLKVLNIDSYDTLNNIMYSYTQAYTGDYTFSGYNAPTNTVDLTLKQNLNEYNGKIKVKYATISKDTGSGYTVSSTGGYYTVNIGAFEIKDTNEDGKIDKEDIKLYRNDTHAEITDFFYDNDERSLKLKSAPGANVDIVSWKEDLLDVNGDPSTTYSITLSEQAVSFDNPDFAAPGTNVDEDKDFILSVQLPPDQMQLTLGTTDINVSLNTTTMETLIEQINDKVPNGIISDLTPDNKLVFRAGTSADFSFGKVLEDGRIVQTYALDAPTIFWEKMGYLGVDGTFGGAWKSDTDVVNNYLDVNALLHNQVSSNNLNIDGRQADGLYDFTKRLELSSQIESNPLLLAVDYGRWTDLDGDWVGELHTPRGGSNVSSTSIISRLSEARYDLMINDGNTSFVDFFGTFVSEMGIEAQTSMRMTSNNQMMLTQIDNERERVKGVSLDEEMSNMIKYQQAFNAAARVVTAVDEMIQRIIDGLGIVGR